MTSLCSAGLLRCPVTAKTLTRFQHRLQRFRIGEPVIVANFDERLRWQSAVGNQFLGVGKWDHVVLARVKDGCLGHDGRGHAPSLPRGAKQDQRRVARFEVHGDGTAARRAHDDVRVMPDVFGLGGADGSIEVVVIESRVDDFVAVVCEVRWLHAPWDTVPTVEKQCRFRFPLARHAFAPSLL